MSASRTRLRGSGVARAEASRFARAGFLTLIFLVAGIPGSFADHLSYPYDYNFCAAFGHKAICEGDGAQLSSDKCDTAYGCSWDGTTCSMNTDNSTTFEGALYGWFPKVDNDSTCHGKDTSDGSCSAADGCFVVNEIAMDTCVPFPKTGVSLLSAHGATNVIQAYYHSLRQSEYCATVNDMTDCLSNELEVVAIFEDGTKRVGSVFFSEIFCTHSIEGGRPVKSFSYAGWFCEIHIPQTIDR